MISRYEAYLNGEALSLIDPSIVVLDIQYSPASIQNATFTLAKRHGANILRRYVDKASVTISFEIHVYNTNERHIVCNEISRWAKNGGILETSDRTGQRLNCICEAFPNVSSVRNWTEPLQIVFSAFPLPFWEEKVPSKVTLSGTEGSGSLFVPGVVDGALVEVSMLANEAVNTADFTVNGKTLSLSGLNMSAGQELKIMYDKELHQSIKVGDLSVLKNRTGVDDLLVDSGSNNDFSFVADGSVTVTFAVRGLWW